MPTKYETAVVKRKGKYFVWVHTPMGTPNVNYPSTFDPDLQHDVGPFETDQQAKDEQVRIEKELRKKGELWIPTHEYKATKKAKDDAKKNAKTKQKALFLAGKDLGKNSKS